LDGITTTLPPTKGTLPYLQETLHTLSELYQPTNQPTPTKQEHQHQPPKGGMGGQTYYRVVEKKIWGEYGISAMGYTTQNTDKDDESSPDRT
jgi:hypothetical protein